MKQILRSCLGYALAFAKWLSAGVVIGLSCGFTGALFALGVNWVTHFRAAHDALIWLLPLGGLAIAGLYRLAKLPLSIGTDKIFTSIRTQESVPVVMAPLIFISTVITHLLGGSAGREGAALQLGGSLGAFLGDRMHPSSDDRRIWETCGMAAVFSALFGTPLTAAFFVLEVVDVGSMYYRALLPCVASSVTASLLAARMGVSAELFPLPEALCVVSAPAIIRVALLAALCAMVAIAFCKLMHISPVLLKRLIPNDFARVFAAGTVIAFASVLMGTRDYNGGGMDVIARALEGNAFVLAFAIKMLFTAVTLGAGFKGGEIVPSFFIGATFGCVAGKLIGLDPSLGAALGLAAVFCGATNTPAASLILSVEMFGSQYLPLFGVAVAVSFMLSGHISLYHSQSFLNRKLGFQARK